MERILDVARQSFATHGAAGTTLRGVAKAAEVDPRLVAYYFDNKETLLDACLVPPADYLEQVEAVTHQPLRGRGKAMVANMVHFWEQPDTGTVLRAILLTAVHEPVAMARLQGIYRTNMVGAVADALGDDQRQLRANLAASQMIGICMTRYIYQLEPIASLPGGDVVELVGPTVQRFLTGRLPINAMDRVPDEPSNPGEPRAARSRPTHGRAALARPVTR